MRKKSAASFEELKPVCQVLILHEDFPAYARAVEACRQMMERHACELDFSIKCWNFIELADPNCGLHAAKSAATADVIVFALRAATLPIELERWLSAMALNRSRQPGVLGVMPGGREWRSLGGAATRLRALAARLGLDFQLLPPDSATSLLRPPRPPTILHPAWE
jgi:hypothetical protein